MDVIELLRMLNWLPVAASAVLTLFNLRLLRRWERSRQKAAAKATTEKDFHLVYELPDRTVTITFPRENLSREHVVTVTNEPLQGSRNGVPEGKHRTDHSFHARPAAERFYRTITENPEAYLLQEQL